MKKLVQKKSLLLVLAALLLYAATIDTGLEPRELEGGDLITHQYAQVQARPSNAPGYPIYTMGGWAWSHSIRALSQLVGNPQPNPLPILSAYSTFWAIIALWLLYQIIHHLTRSKPLAWILSAFLAVTYFFWYYATTTEQYSSAVAQTVAILYVYLLWRKSPTKSHKLLLLLAFLCGISLAHMLTVAFIVPPLIIVVLLDNSHLQFWRPLFWKSKRQIGNFVAVIGAGILPLLSYLYVYVRGAAHPEWWGNGEWTTANQWFWAFISTAQGREELSWGLQPDAPFWGGGFPELIWQELSIPLFVLGILGIAFLGRRLAFVLYTTLIIYALFCWAYRLGNWFQVILPAYPLILIGVAQIIHKVLSILRQTARAKIVQQAATALVYALLIGAILWRGSTSLAQGVNSRNRAEDTALTTAQTLLDPLLPNQTLPQDAALFGALDETLALQYLNQIWRIRPDLSVIDRREVAARLQQSSADNNEFSTPIFATRRAARRLYDELMLPRRNYGLDLRLSSHGPDWVRVQPSSEPVGNQPFPRVRLDQQILDEVFLVGYDLDIGKSGSQQALFVTLYWRLPTGTWPAGLSLSVRPTNDGAFVLDPNSEQPNAIIQQDNGEPMQGLFDLLRLQPNDTIADPYRIPLSTGNKRMANGALVILYRVTESGFENVAEIRLE